MKYLGTLGIYIATQSKRDSLDAGWEIAKELRLDWRDADNLLTLIFLAEKYGVDSDLEKRAQDIVPMLPEYERIKELLGDCK